MAHGINLFDNQQPTRLAAADALRVLEDDRPGAWLTFLQAAQTCPRASSARSRTAETPLHLAAEQLRPDYCGLLLARGADPNAVEACNRWTPLHAVLQDRALYVGDDAAAENHLLPLLAGEAEVRQLEEEVVEVLLRGGARLDAEDDEGETPLMHAVRYGRGAALRAMLRATESPPGWGRAGGEAVVVNAARSLLATAVEFRSLDAVEVLCETGVEFVEEENWPRLRDTARENDLLEIDDVLRRHGLACRREFGD